MDFLLGALLLAACFASLCAYASYQRQELSHTVVAPVSTAPVAQR